MTRLRENERGEATTEMVLVVPVLLVLITLVIQFGLWYHASNVADAAAEEGVRAARLRGGTAEAGQATTENFLSQAGPTIVVAPEVSVSRDSDTARVEVHGSVVSVVPGIRLPIDALAESPLEEFRPPARTAP
jgi:Flp pilus assembly protein TadG